MLFINQQLAHSYVGRAYAITHTVTQMQMLNTIKSEFIFAQHARRRVNAPLTTLSDLSLSPILIRDAARFLGSLSFIYSLISG